MIVEWFIDPSDTDVELEVQLKVSSLLSSLRTFLGKWIVAEQWCIFQIYLYLCIISNLYLITMGRRNFFRKYCDRKVFWTLIDTLMRHDFLLFLLFLLYYFYNIDNIQIQSRLFTAIIKVLWSDLGGAFSVFRCSHCVVLNVCL